MLLHHQLLQALINNLSKTQSIHLTTSNKLTVYGEFCNNFQDDRFSYLAMTFHCFTMDMLFAFFKVDNQCVALHLGLVV